MDNVKKVIVFGATGQTGTAILRRAIAEKLTVTAYVRTPSRVPEDLQKDVTIVKGDCFNQEQVENVIEGQDAVLSALGNGMSLGDTTIMSEGCKNIISGMKKHGIRKLAVVSGESLLPNRSIFFLFKKAAADHIRQLEVLKSESENIDWTAMMAPRIRDNSTVNENYMVAKNESPGGVSRVNTAELADFMVKYVTDEETFNQHKHVMTGISSHPKKGWFSWLSSSQES